MLCLADESYCSCVLFKMFALRLEIALKVGSCWNCEGCQLIAGVYVTVMKYKRCGPGSRDRAHNQVLEPLVDAGKERSASWQGQSGETVMSSAVVGVESDLRNLYANMST